MLAALLSIVVLITCGEPAAPEVWDLQVEGTAPLNGVVGSALQPVTVRVTGA